MELIWAEIVSVKARAVVENHLARIVIAEVPGLGRGYPAGIVSVRARAGVKGT